MDKNIYFGVVTVWLLQAIIGFMSKILKSIKIFDGKNYDVVAWTEKLTTVAKITKECVTEVIPMLLEGAAYDVWNNLSDDSKEKQAEIEKALFEAFGMSKIDCFESLRERKLRRDESLDEYVQAIRKLSKRSGVSESEKLLVLFVVTGLPSDIRTKIQTMIRMEDLDKVSLDDIIEKARILWQETRKNDGSVAFATRSYRQDVTCFKCRKRGHFARDCHVQRVSPARCYSCGESGHNARSCSAQSKPPLTDFKKNITGAVKLLSNPGTPAETILSVNGRRARCLIDKGKQHDNSSRGALRRREAMVS